MVDTLDEAVETCAKLAEPGECVLLHQLAQVGECLRIMKNVVASLKNS